MKRLIIAILSVFLCAAAQAAPAGQYRNFRAAIYVVVNTVKELSDPAAFEAQYATVARQLKFDKVYIEVYRNHVFATDAEIETVKRLFAAKGVAVAGGVTLAAGGDRGQFGTFDYEYPADRDECRKASELAAAHFDEVILDDFFFYTSKSEADIAAKGTRSWTQYRLDTMRKVAADLVIGPAKQTNPRVRMVIKYPNWYEHFQGLGYDLEKESRAFDGIYTGTETREASRTDQLLQPYQSFEIVRYFDAIRPPDVPGGGNGGGWVDTYSLANADRYVEQLQDTLLAKTGEITLFNWVDMAGSWKMPPGMKAFGPRPGRADAWVNKAHFAAMMKGYVRAGKRDPGPSWARAAGFALEGVDAVLGDLGKPVGVAAYKPYQSHGDDFLQNYLGMIGLPIAMSPNFPIGADLILLTESASFDPDIVKKIALQLSVGKNVVVTSGFVQAMQDKGFKDIAEWEVTGRKALVGDFVDGYGAGNGTSLNDAKHPTPAVLLPEVRFFTNDSWAILRGTAGAKGYPVLLTNAYAKGKIFLLTVPDNPADLYRLPQGLLTRIKAYLQEDAAVRIDSPAGVALFTYDNGTFVLRNYRDVSATVEISLAGEGVCLVDLPGGHAVAPKRENAAERQKREMMRRWFTVPERTVFRVTLPPHAFVGYRVTK